MSAMPAPTASKVSNGFTSAPAGNTSILMRPPVASPIVCASRTALGWSPGMLSGQPVTNLSCRIPWAIAGAGRLNVAPAANDPAPARISLRLMAALLWKDAHDAPHRIGQRDGHLTPTKRAAAAQEGAVGDVAPIHDRRAEPLIALVDFPGSLVARAGLGHHILADLVKRPQQRVVELQDLDGAFLPQPAQRQCVVRGELRQRRAYSPAAPASISRRSLALKLSHTRLLMPSVWAVPGSWKPG